MSDIIIVIYLTVRSARRTVTFSFGEHGTCGVVELPDLLQFEVL